MKNEKQIELAFLEDIATDVVEESRVRPYEKVARFGSNTSDGTLIRPGGRGCYPAFWVRDFAKATVEQ